jgi:hypothetical protein
MKITKLIRKGGTFKHDRLTYHHPCLEQYVGKRIEIEPERRRTEGRSIHILCSDLDTCITIGKAQELHLKAHMCPDGWTISPEYHRKLTGVRLVEDRISSA